MRNNKISKFPSISDIRKQQNYDNFFSFFMEILSLNLDVEICRKRYLFEMWYGFPWCKSEIYKGEFARNDSWMVIYQDIYGDIWLRNKLIIKEFKGRGLPTYKAVSTEPDIIKIEDYHHMMKEINRMDLIISKKLLKGTTFDDYVYGRKWCLIYRYIVNFNILCDMNENCYIDSNGCSTSCKIFTNHFQ